MAADEPLPASPEPVPETRAPESLTLRPGRGEPIIIVAMSQTDLDAPETDRILLDNEPKTPDD